MEATHDSEEYGFDNELMPHRLFRFVACDTGILIAVLFTTSLLSVSQLGRVFDWIEPGLSRAPGAMFVSFGCFGFLGGAILAYHHVFRLDSAKSSYPQLLSNACMFWLWSANVLLGLMALSHVMGFRQSFWPFGKVPELLFVLFVCGVAGVLVGRPILHLFSRLPLRHGKPFGWVNERISQISSKEKAFAVGVFLHSVVAVLLLALGLLILALLLLSVSLWIFGAILRVASGGPLFSSDGKTAPPPDRSSVEEGWFGEQEIHHADGSRSRVRQGLFGDKLLEHDNGMVSRQKQGIFGDDNLEHEDGSVSRLRQGVFGGDYLEHEDGSVSSLEDGLLGGKYIRNEGQTNALTGHSRKEE